MAENTAIEWTDHTFNPWEGCQKVGPGCDHCYAETRNARYNGGQAPNWGPGAPRRRTSESNWNQPRKWQRQAEAFDRQWNRRQRVFCASLADVFDNAAPDSWRDDLFNLIDDCPDLDWLLLTKRVGNVPAMLETLGREKLPDNVWLGATIVNQAEADRDIPKLLAIKATVRFLSMEPLLGPVDLNTIWLRRNGERPTDLSNRLGDYVQPLRGNFTNSPKVDWVIVGGESGAGARPLHPAWARQIRDECAASGTPFLFKQWGEWMPSPECSGYLGHDLWTQDDGRRTVVWPDGQVGNGRAEDHGGRGYRMERLGKKHSGRELDGITHTMFPRPR